MRKLLKICFLLIVNFSLAQSTSVFDANYFKQDNTEPSLRVGKGFHINDVYKQTRSCFSSETTNRNNLVSQQIGGKKTTIKIFYTKSNEEYNLFKSKGSSGKVSFLNLFSAGGKKLEQMTAQETEGSERLIFYANVDFGVYSFDKDLELIPEAKSLIDQNKLQEFVKLFGTHYISGIRKESNIMVILTNKNKEVSFNYENSQSTSTQGKIPLKGLGNFEVQNKSDVNKFIQENEFSLDIEVNGPTINQNAMRNQISQVLNGDVQNKSEAISDIIGVAIENMSNPEQGVITQYYYAPYSLYGLDGIYWDEKKQNQLSKINQAIITAYTSKKNYRISSSTDGVKTLVDLFGFSKNYADRIYSIFNEGKPYYLKAYNQTEQLLKQLENQYNKCADVFCNVNDCCDFDEDILKQTEEIDLEFKKDTKELEVAIEAVFNEALAETRRPACEKGQKGIIRIHNKSSNPYEIYDGYGKLLGVLEGNNKLELHEKIGYYIYKAVQRSGYMMYPTVNNRQAIITKVCQEIDLTIGYED